MIPSAVVASDTPGSERKVFRLLQSGLDDDYVVLHNVSWLTRGERRRPVDGQADFVVTHPELGVLVLEVKGGEIRFDAASGRWFTKPGGSPEAQLKESPLEQARRNMYALRDLLQEAPGWNRAWDVLGRAVCFPGGSVNQRFPDDVARSLLTMEHTRDEKRFGERLEDVMRWWCPDNANFSEVGQQKVVDLLAQDIDIRRPLGAEVRQSDQEIIRLSERQYRVLDHLSKMRRVEVSGPAGSGKTLLALEKSKRLAAQGSDVLLTCFNRPLADFLASSVDRSSASDDPEMGARLQVMTFHQLSSRLSRQAGIKGWSEDEAGELLLNAADLVGPMFDAIVVDEAQDFESDWWMPLSMLLKDPDQGILYVFYDSNQKIYRRPAELPDGLVPVPLNESWRNTKQIFESVDRFYSGEAVSSMGPPGPDVVLEEVEDSASVSKVLSRLLHRLIREEEIGPNEVVVLTTDARLRDELVGAVGSFNLVQRRELSEDVLVESVHRFKGLDSPAVVLVDAGGSSSDQQDKLLYVGCSRARSLLVICAQEDVLVRLGGDS